MNVSRSNQQVHNNAPIDLWWAKCQILLMDETKVNWKSTNEYEKKVIVQYIIFLLPNCV